MQTLNYIFDHLAAIIVTTVVVLFIIVATWSTIAWRKEYPLRLQRDKDQDAARAARARQLGWHYEGTREDDIKFRLRGTLADGGPWQIYFNLDAGSSNASPQLIFQAEQKRSAKPRIYIGDETNYKALSAGIGRKMLGAARFMLDGLSGGKLALMAEFYDRAVTRKDGDWIIAATESHLLATPGVANAMALLQRWPEDMQGRKPYSKNVEVWQDKDGLRVELQGEYTDMAACEHLQRIGSQLAAGLGAHLS